ncbi:MAG: hypothetical protein K2L38_05465 [Dysosmobacter sp.]|nr:hypothetical protein [Dysosmobacter sp.]
MGQKEYSVPQLLRDIKELLLGIALILFAIALILLGLALRNDFNSEILYWIAGPLVLAYGGFHTWNGWARHKVIDKNDESPEQGK